MRCYLLFLFLLLTSNALDWKQWVTTPGTTTQGVMVMTGAVAYWAPRAVGSVYGNCFRYDENQKVSRWIGGQQCADAIGTQALIFGIGLSALGQATGWYKRDDTMERITELVPDNVVTQLVLPDLDNLEQRDLEYISIGVVNGLKIHVTHNLLKEMANDTVMAITHKNLIKREQRNTTDETMPYTLLRIGEHGINMHVLSVLNSEVSRREDNPNPPNSWDNLYTTGGSVWLECQYGAGLSNADAEYMAHQFGYDYKRAGEGHALHWQYNAYHGYIGDDLRLKCATKAYDYKTDNNGWRQWDDVWSSF